MARGKAPQPPKPCGFCGQPLPEVRHPSAAYCNPTCRQRKQWERAEGVACRVCGRKYKRVGSHVVQVHGYDSSADYRWEFGLAQSETRLDGYADTMSEKFDPKRSSVVEAGKATRFKPKDERIKTAEWWRKRRENESKRV